MDRLDDILMVDSDFEVEYCVSTNIMSIKKNIVSEMGETKWSGAHLS